ncbi:hypothetical protein EJB05_27649, partial [Eragrostis curvula]
MSHVNAEYLHELQELQPMTPKRAALDANELHTSLRWSPFEIGGGGEDAERRKVLDKIRDAFSSLCTFKRLFSCWPCGQVDQVCEEQALWHLRQFHDRFLAVPLVLPHFTAEVHCIIYLLCKIFNAWNNEKDHGVNTFPSTDIASEVISTIFETLHDSHMSLHPDSETLEHRGICTSRNLDFVCRVEDEQSLLRSTKRDMGLARQSGYLGDLAPSILPQEPPTPNPFLRVRLQYP